jgi:Fe-S oxidoreductase
MYLMTREGLQQDRLGWLPDDIALSAESSTIFFVGCAPYFDVVFRDLGVATLEGAKGALRLLNRAKVPIDILANEHCCGRDLLLQGDRKGFQALAQANLEEFRRRGAKKIITYCPECYYTLGVDYPRVVGGTGIEVVHLTQVLAPLVRSGELRLGKLGEKVTYHDPCTLGRCSRLFDEPRLILSSVAGLDLVEMEQSREKALCCGATPWVRCGAVNQQIQKRRLEQANSTGAAMLVTACPKCEIHLKCACKTSGGNAGDIMIKDFASLVAQSSGLGGQSGG